MSIDAPHHTFQNGHILLSLAKLETENCKVQNLSFIIIPNTVSLSPINPSNIEPHSIPAENFCFNSTIGMNTIPPMESLCNVNPYGFGCNVNCDKNPEHLECEKIPICDGTDGAGKTPVVPGCNGAALDCAKYPTAPSCLPNCIETSGTHGCPLDCAKYPGALACVPNCSNKPYLPGCNDCIYNPNASGCSVCGEPNSQKIWRCQFGYCDSNPNAPECRLIKDKINFHTITDTNSNNIIITSYYCNLLLNGDTCFHVIGKEENKEMTFINKFGDGASEELCKNGKIGKNIHSKRFIYVCYKSKNGEIFWRTYKFEGRLEETGIGYIYPPVSIYTFNSYLTNVFAIEDGGYCIITSVISINNGTTIFARFLQKDSHEMKGPFRIYWNNTVTRLRIYVCNIAYQSSGYSCIIQTTNGNQVIYNEIDFFLSYGEVIVKVIDLNLNLSNNDVITDVLPLNFGGYFITTMNRINGNGSAFAIDNEGVNHGNWHQAPGEFFYISLVLPNNHIVAIPKAASIFDEINRQKILIISTDQFTNFSTVVGGDGKVPGGPGGYGCSKILSTTPSKNSKITTNQEFTITYNTPVIRSTGNFSVFQVSGYDIITLKQTIPATNEQFVEFENENTVKLTILPSVLNKFASYYITVDHDFVKEQSGQNVIGIRENIWSFTTDSSSSTDVETGGTVSTIIRLTHEGSLRYIQLHPDKQKAFISSLETLLSRAISCYEICLNIIKYYQHDATSCKGSCSFITYYTSYKLKKNEILDLTNNAHRYQIIFRVDISKNEKSSSEQLAKDLNETITYKYINSLSSGLYGDFLDASYGAPITEKLWKKYWGLLPTACILFLIGLLLIIKRDFRDFFPIFLSGLILIDLALDIAFIIFHKGDFVWILPAT
ncbi:hypothetical protein RhiirA4_480478 [Rhizophagus irregularis]|uniref:Uncharacterized protein n=1 Tax=Rhizophagus irregularis TaxID=588596 RepID=A0A2I1HHY9_9GLOM|nr:hypothetical protein RhiirA4_480478 [Rhizophagus irregularis]